MKFETSWDDGSIHDAKLVQLLDAYRIPAMFYMPINCEIGLHFVRKISKSYEIGCHTVTHPMDLKTVEQPFLQFEVQSAKEMLEIVIERPVTSFCYPRGRYNDAVVDVVRNAGFKEARTTEVLCTTETQDLFRKPTTIHAFQRKEYNDAPWDLLAMDCFDKAKRENGYFHLWGHSAEIEKTHCWGKLEKVLKYISGRITNQYSPISLTGEI